MINEFSGLIRSNPLLKKFNPRIFAVVLLLAFTMAICIFTNPIKPDPRKYNRVSSIELTTYKANVAQKIPLEANQTAQRKLSLDQMNKLAVISNAHCIELLKSYNDIKSTELVEILISIYHGSPYVHLDIKLKATLSDKVEPQEKRFHQTFNLTGDSIKIIETKFLY